MRCPVHGVRLEVEERFEDSRPVGGIGWQREERFVVIRYVCRVDDCREHGEWVA